MLTDEETKKIAEDVRSSILSDVDKRVDSKVSDAAPKIVRNMKENQDLWDGKLKEYLNDLPDSLKESFTYIVGSTMQALGDTVKQVNRDNIDELFKEMMKKAGYNKGLIERELATQNANADKSTITDEKKDEPNAADEELKKDGTPGKLPGNSVQTSDGSVIELDKTKGATDGQQDEELDVLIKYPLAHDGVYLEARQKKFLASKGSGAGTSSADLVKEIDLSKHKLTAQQ